MAVLSINWVLGAKRSWWRRGCLALVAGVFVPLLASSAVHRGDGGDWWSARRDATGLAPDPATTPDAVVQVYAARAFGWRGTFGVHTWIVAKRGHERQYSRYEVLGWGVSRGSGAIRISQGNPDSWWYGNRPVLLVDLRGPNVDPIVDKVRAAVARYPYTRKYRIWPGPNSNTFTAAVGRQVPELRLELPPTAIGKDYLPGGAVVGWTPSRTGVQFSIFGLLGLALGLEEGVELNLLGFVLGVDFNDLALKLPGLGAVRLGRSTASAETRRPGQD